MIRKTTAWNMTFLETRTLLRQEDKRRQIMSWQFDPGHTYIGFTGRHLMVATVRGEFERFNGTVEFDEQDITRSKADIQIAAASVNTRNAERDEHFRSADFFDVEHYPYITFTSKRVIMQDAHHGQLVGDLTIRNITREVVLDGEYSGVSQTPWNTYSAGFSLRGKVNRKEWGLNWNMLLAGGGLVAGDEITLAIDLELTRPVEVAAPTPAGEASA
jgi:polyisoprenoid-binding protein YceI